MLRTGRSRDDYGFATYERDNWTCRYCGFKGHDAISFRFLSIDHVIRVADGGSDDGSNLVTACRACNDYLNRSSFPSFVEKQAAVREKIAAEARFFEQAVRPRLL